MTRLEIISLLDAYFLGDERDRKGVFAKVAAWQPDLQSAEPIVRAINLVGSRAADESLIALRLILQGHPLEDDRVLQLRTIIQLIASGDSTGRAQYLDLMAQHQ